MILQDIGKLEEVSEVGSHASKITKYIYNHCYALFFMRKYTSGREIFCPTLTCVATNFIALQSILAQKDALRAMVTFKECTSSTYAKVAKVKQSVEHVLDFGFWNKWVDVVKLTKPLVCVLCMIDSEDKFPMGFLIEPCINLDKRQ